MFSNLILRNSHRSRKENGLFFSSLVISIVAFYMILSISTQDVMLFLQKMESDAVDKLLLLIPAFYGMTLGILFFLTNGTEQPFFIADGRITEEISEQFHVGVLPLV
jgi:putative ABC transport system permease protein